MTDMQTPVAMPGEHHYTQLCQVTVTADEQVARVNELLGDGWRIVDIGHRPDATVYVLGRLEDKPKHRTGFLAAD
jgi:hypothetical protein